MAWPGLSFAQADRPVWFILPNATGSGVDAITRAAAPALGKAPGTRVVMFMVALKAKPDGFNFGSGGTGTILHLAAQRWKDEAGVKARHIPCKGVGPGVTDLLGGQIDFAVVALPSVQQHIKSGALRAAFHDPVVQDTMGKQGNTMAISAVEQAQKTFRSDMERLAALVRKVGIEPQSGRWFHRLTFERQATTIIPHVHPGSDFRHSPRAQHAGQALRAAAGCLNLLQVGGFSPDMLPHAHALSDRKVRPAIPPFSV